jgi:HPt (histidine-containing phosphotransfer) domain-containing protein
MNGHLGKPFKRTELLAAVERWGAAQAGPLDHGTPGENAVEDVTTSLTSAFDRGVFDDLVETVGADQARLWLERLRDEVITRFLNGDPASLPDSDFARAAHGIVSQAGMLGFRDLSDRSSALEVACLQATGERSELLENVMASARAALLIVDAIRKSMPAAPTMADS